MHVITPKFLHRLVWFLVGLVAVIVTPLLLPALPSTAAVPSSVVEVQAVMTPEAIATSLETAGSHQAPNFYQ